MTPYRKPPIVEAVIEVQFADAPLSMRDMQRFIKKVEKKYPHSDLMREFNMQVNVNNGIASGSEATVTMEWYKCVGHDAADILNIRPKSLVTARTAPYTSWEVLFDSFNEDFHTLTKLVGFKKLTRLGTRYINRLDVPSPRSEPVDPRTYLNIFPAIPFSKHDKFSSHFTSLQYKDDDNTGINIHSGQLEPILINHSSLVLDIDVYTTDGIPLKTESALTCFEHLRKVKNQLFEQLVTDTGKLLFK